MYGPRDEDVTRDMVATGSEDTIAVEPLVSESARVVLWRCCLVRSRPGVLKALIP